MRASLIVIAALFSSVGVGACGGESVKPRVETPPKRGQLRVKNRKLYNQVYQKSLLLEPRKAEAEFARAQQEMERVNPKDAGDASKGAALFQRGYLAAEAREYRKAIKLFEELVRRFPKHAYADDALYQIGYVYQHHLKDFNKAAEAYTRLAKDKTYRGREVAPQAMYQNAQVAAQQGRVKDLVDNLNAANTVAGVQRSRRKQTSVPSYYETQSSQMLKFVGRNSAPGKSNTEALALYLRGEGQLQQGRVKAAEGNFSKIQKKYAKSKLADDAAFGLAECRRRDYKLDEAAKLYAEFIKKFPDSEHVPLATFRLAELKRFAGKSEEAAKLYKDVRSSLTKYIAERLKLDPKVTREDISPDVRRALELSESRLKEMRAVETSR
jgi:TolA-binding protein